MRSAAAQSRHCRSAARALVVHAAICGIGLVAAGNTSAQPGSPDEPYKALDLTPLIRALDSVSLAERDRAVEQLGSNPAITAREVLSILRDVQGLTPEQRARLVDLGRAMFKNSPRAAMGIQFGGTVESGVAVATLIEGFDASRQLRPGDVIEAANGEPLSQNRLRAVIISHDPGETMSLRVRRLDAEGRAESIDVRVALGSFNRLRGGGFLDSQTLDEAWRIRMSREGVITTGAQGVIGVAVDRDAWLASAQALARWADSDIGPGTARSPRAGVAGESRSEWYDSGSESFSMHTNGRDPNRMEVDAQRLVLLERLQVLQLQMEAMRSAQRANLAALQNPSLSPSERAKLLNENERLAQELLPLERQMTDLRGALNRRQ